MKTLCLVVAVGLVFPAAFAGTISGKVRAQGKLVAEEDAAGGAYQSKKFKFVEKIDYSAMQDFVVYIEGPIAGSAPPPSGVKIIQTNACFEPHVLPVMVGTTVEFPNMDEIFHNVYSRSQANQFNLGLYKKGDADKSVTFDKLGEVDVFCSIHTRMSCIILVLDNPYFAKSDVRGHYAIANVPPGKYNLVAWQERLMSKTQQITVPESGDIKVDFVLGPDVK